LQVEAIVQGQLLMFDAMSEASKSDVGPSLNRELRRKTLEWAAVRDQWNMDRGKTDKYICQLYEILAKGKIHHTILEEPM